MMSRICVKCKQYVNVFETYESKKQQDRFDAMHVGHPLGIIPRKELSGYTIAQL